MHNELVKQNKILFEQIISIGKELANQQNDLYQAIKNAEFILDKVPGIRLIENNNEYLKYVFNKADVSGGGIYLEFGVYKGKTVNLIAEAFPDKIIYGFDSFEGLPEDWRGTVFSKGAFNANGHLPPVRKNVRLVKGWFNKTLPEFVKPHPEPCAFIHVDCDLYSSTKTIFDNLKNQIVSGTIIAFDEYFGYPRWADGEYKAFMEFVEENNLEFEYIARTNGMQVAAKIL